MQTSATLKLFIPHGDSKRLRTGEVSNWTGKALAAPRTDVDELLAREELENSGVYFLFGSDPNTGDPLAYIGEAEIVRDRLKQHRSKDFWVWVVVFVSKDENLTKAHIRYLENRLIEEAKKVGRYRLENSNVTTAKLPESDREDMEVFLSRIGFDFRRVQAAPGRAFPLGPAEPSGRSCGLQSPPREGSRDKKRRYAF